MSIDDRDLKPDNIAGAAALCVLGVEARPDRATLELWALWWLIRYPAAWSAVDRSRGSDFSGERARAYAAMMVARRHDPDRIEDEIADAAPTIAAQLATIASTDIWSRTRTFAALRGETR